MNGVVWKHCEDKCYLIQINKIKKANFAYLKEILGECEVFSNGYVANDESWIQINKIFFESQQDMFDWVKELSFPVLFENNRGKKIKVNDAVEA